MNKDLASKLIKIANKLDDIGYFNEANSLTKIAQSDFNYKMFPSGDYAEDIKNYKKIIKLQQENSSDYWRFNDLKSSATYFLNGIKNSVKYTPDRKEAFLLQAKSIRNEIYANLDGEKLNNKLSNLLNYYRIIDEKGKVLYSYDELKNHWDKYIQKEFEIDNIYIARWLTNKFNMLILKIKNQNSQPKSNTNNTNEKSETPQEKLSRLFSFYRYKDENGKVLYTQEELKNHWKKYIEAQFNLNDKNISSLLDSEFKKLISEIKKQNAQK